MTLKPGICYSLESFKLKWPKNDQKMTKKWPKNDQKMTIINSYK